MERRRRRGDKTITAEGEGQGESSEGRILRNGKKLSGLLSQQRGEQDTYTNVGIGLGGKVRELYI
jgi:hypothetical protein